MAGEFKINGFAAQREATDDGPQVASPLTGLTGYFVSNIPAGKPIPADGGIMYVPPRGFIIGMDGLFYERLADGSTSDTPGLNLTADDPDFELESPLQWQYTPDDFAIGGKLIELASYWFDAKEPGWHGNLDELTPVPGVEQAGGTRGMRGPVSAWKVVDVGPPVMWRQYVEETDTFVGDPTETPNLIGASESGIVVLTGDDEEARNAIKALGSLRADKLITVGSGGDFATINEALREASRYAPDYLSTPSTWPAIRGRIGVEIRLLSGFVMAEQVFVVQQDLSYVMITSEDAVVTIQRSAITGDNGSSTTAPGINNWRTGTHPAWCAMRNATLPFIKALFSFDTSGDGAGTVGFYIFENSRAVLFQGAGVKNAGWRGLYVDGADCYARGTIWDGAGYATGPGGTLAGIRIANGAKADVREASAKHCASGCYVSGATAIVISLDVTGAGTDADGTPVGGAEGIGLACDFSTVFGAGVKADNCTNYGVYVRDGGYCTVVRDTNGNDLSATGCGVSAVRVENGSTLIAPRAILGSASHCLSVAGASKVDVNSSTITATAGSGVIAADGSEVAAEASTITGAVAGNWGVRLYSSRLDATGAKIGGPDGGVQLNSGAVLNKSGATALDGASVLSCNVLAGEISANGMVIGADQRVEFRNSDTNYALTASISPSGMTAEHVINIAVLTADRNFTLYDSTSLPSRRHTITNAAVSGKAVKVYKESGATTLLATLMPGHTVKVTPDGSGGWLAVGTDASRKADSIRYGFSTIPRWAATGSSITSGSTSGDFWISYLEADQNLLAANITVISGGTAAAATPTLVRFGLYSVAENGDLTLIGSTANDTTLLAAINTVYTKALSSSVAVKKGASYAIGVLVVSGAAMPTFAGVSGRSASYAVAPRLTGFVAAQSDLPSTVAAGSVSNSANLLYAKLAA